MAPGPPKSFDPDAALADARDLFWRRGFDGTAISDLESVLGIGRKSLYDTFGSKRDLYLRALELYADTVIQRICDRLEDPGGRAIHNLEQVLEKLQRHHGSGRSLGCLLGVAMAQVEPGDEELGAVLRDCLLRLERAVERTVSRAQQEGAVRADARPKDVARNLVASMQGMALMGRVLDRPAWTRSIVRAALDGLKP